MTKCDFCQDGDCCGQIEDLKEENEKLRLALVDLRDMDGKGRDLGIDQAIIQTVLKEVDKD